jgi:hypothetical protein
MVITLYNVRTAVNGKDVWAEKTDSYEHLGMVQIVQFGLRRSSTLYVYFFGEFFRRVRRIAKSDY